MATLREQLENRNVKYRLENVSVQAISLPDSHTVQLEDGRYKEVDVDGVYLTRFGRGDSTVLSDAFDPSNDEHAKYIAIVDEWIAKNPVKAAENGISKIGAVRPPVRVQNWDNMDEDQILNVLEATQTDLLWAMEFELMRPAELGGPRQEVIDTVEDLYARGFTKKAEQSQEAPAL